MFVKFVVLIVSLPGWAGECLWGLQLAVWRRETAMLFTSVWEGTARLKFSQPWCPTRNPCKYETHCCWANSKSSSGTEGCAELTLSSAEKFLSRLIQRVVNWPVKWRDGTSFSREMFEFSGKQRQCWFELQGMPGLVDKEEIVSFDLSACLMTFQGGNECFHGESGGDGATGMESHSCLRCFLADSVEFIKTWGCRPECGEPDNWCFFFPLSVSYPSAGSTAASCV